MEKAAAKLTFAIIKKGNTSANEVTGDLNLITSLDEVKIKWTSNKPDVISSTGVVTRPPVDTDVELTATLSHEKFEDKIVKITVKVLKVGTDPNPDVKEKKLKEIFDVEFSLSPSYEMMVVSNVGVQELLHVIDQELIDALDLLNIKYEPISAEDIPEDDRSLEYLSFQISVIKADSAPEETRQLVVGFGSDDGVNWHMVIHNLVTNEAKFFKVLEPGNTIKNLIYMWKGEVTQENLFGRLFVNKTNQTAQIFAGSDPLEELSVTSNNQEKINSDTFNTKIITLEEAKALLNNTLTVTTLQTLLKETSGEEVLYSKKIAIYNFNNGKNIIMVHDYSKTKTDVDSENYVLCLEITELFEINIYVEELKNSKRFEDLIKHEIGDEYITVAYHLGESIIEKNSDNDPEIKPFLKKLEFDLEAITSAEYTEKTSFEGQAPNNYHELFATIRATDRMQVGVDIVSLDENSWYICTYNIVGGLPTNHQYFKIIFGEIAVKNKIASYHS